MKAGFFFSAILGVALFLFVPNGDALRENGVCSWVNYKNSSCSKLNFLCFDGQCIDRALYCNGRYDCGDRSDESYCNSGYNNCPRNRGMKPCPESQRCIREEWFCDGIPDCPHGKDELGCDGIRGNEMAAKGKALRWLNATRRPESASEVWGSDVVRAAVVLYLAGNQSKNGSQETRREMAYEASIQLLSRLSKMKLQDIPSTDLASYVNAFLVTCVDPRKFQGLDIVQELRTRVDRQNYTNPYVLLSLCNAGVTITESDKMKLIDAFWAKHRAFWTDIQAGVLMALACASRQPGSDVDSDTVRELAMELKQHQYRNGTVENLQTTALVMQALLAAEPDSDPDNFDDTKALQQMIAMQREDGSFGSFANAYYVLPVLNCMSLVNISSAHCEPSRRDEISALDDLTKRSGPKIRVHYSIWFGKDRDLERNLALRVPANMSFYGIMELAAELDNRYRFEYVVKNRKPYVNALSGLQDDPEKGKFWFLYTVVDGKPSPSRESPADVKSKDNEHFVMWYRSGSWID